MYALIGGVLAAGAALVPAAAPVLGDNPEDSAPRTGVERPVDPVQAAVVRHEVDRELRQAAARAERRAERRKKARKAKGGAAASGSAKASGGGGSAPPQLEAIAACESGGDPNAVGGGGQFRGKYQFDVGTWQSVGGSGDPAAAPEAEQDKRAAMLYQRAGSSPWPVCGS